MKNKQLVFTMLSFLFVLGSLIYSSCEKDIIYIETEPSTDDFTTVMDVPYTALSYGNCMDYDVYVINTQQELDIAINNCGWIPSSYPHDIENSTLLGNVITVPHSKFVVSTSVQKDTLTKTIYFRLHAKESESNQPIQMTPRQFFSFLKVDKIPPSYDIQFEESITYPKHKY